MTNAPVPSAGLRRQIPISPPSRPGPGKDIGETFFEHLLSGKFHKSDTTSLLGAGYQETRQRIRELESLRRSNRLPTLAAREHSRVAQFRHTTNEKPAQLVEPDLDWVVMKAIEKDRDRRYATTNGVQPDIDRFLHGAAVLARPPTFPYRLSRYVRRHLLQVTLFSLVCIEAHAEVEYHGRIGLHNTQHAANDTAAGWSSQVDFIFGGSSRYNGLTYLGQAAWIADTRTGSTTRVGFFGAPEYADADHVENSFFTGVSETGMAIGRSSRYSGRESLGTVAWVADARSGSTTRLGLIGTPEFTATNGGSASAAKRLTNSGFVTGSSSRFIGAVEAGEAVWVADAASGLTRRVGFYGTPEFTQPDGREFSDAIHLTDTGFLSGFSHGSTDPSGSLTQVAWVAHATTASTLRVGLYAASEFVDPDEFGYSDITHVTESGWLAGCSLRSSSVGGGQGAWMADALTGTTTRVGLYGTPEFTHAEGGASSSLRFLTESGVLAGDSVRYDGFSAHAGQAAWALDTTSRMTTRVGFYDAPEFVQDGGVTNSHISHVTESRLIVGGSSRYDGMEYLGQVAWVMAGVTGTEARVGFYDPPEIARLSGGFGSRIHSVTESGYLAGMSFLASAGQVAWIANAADGKTTRVGLYGGSEFPLSDGKGISVPTHVTESGYVIGHSNRSNGLGHGAWVADGRTGSTFRVGLYGTPEFTSSDGRASSSSLYVSQTGIVTGISKRFDNGVADKGQAVWVADPATGSTTRLGLYDRPGYTSSDGTSASGIGPCTVSGLIAGDSFKYIGDGLLPGQTAWIYDVTTQRLTTLDLSVRPSDGYAYSFFWGLTEQGVAYGQFQKFDGENNLGLRPFIWTRESGPVALEDAIPGGVERHGWKLLSNIVHVSENNMIIGTGSPIESSAGREGTFVARIVRSPSTPTDLKIEIIRSGRHAIITFGGGVLQQSSDSTLGSFSDIPGATSPHFVPIESPDRFFRLRQ